MIYLIELYVIVHERAIVEPYLLKLTQQHSIQPQLNIKDTLINRHAPTDIARRVGGASREGEEPATAIHIHLKNAVWAQY